MSSEPSDSRRQDGSWVGWLERRVNVSEIFSFITHFGVIYTPVDVQQPVRDVVREVARHPVPAYAAWPRVLGLLAAILFGVQALTGVLLAFYYRPTPEAAFESTRTIVRDLPAGWFIHQVHAWGARLLVVVIVLRLLRLFWDGLYRAPREVLWWSAVLMAWLVLQFDFTGGLLNWDSHSYWSTVRGMEVVLALPVVGPVLAFLSGGNVVNEDVLLRFYIYHLLVLPVFYSAFLYLTFATLRRVGLSQESETARRGVTTFRAHWYDMLIFTVLIFGILVTLATLVPFPFLSVADPYSTPPAVRPPWYMLAPYALLQGVPLPRWVTGVVLVAAALAVLLLPLWLRERDGAASRRKARILGTIALVVWAALSVLGALLDRAQSGG